MVCGKIISWNIHKQPCRVPSVSSVNNTAAGDLSSGSESKADSAFYGLDEPLKGSY